MKILHVITTISRGGAENHLMSLIQHQLVIEGFEVTVAFLKGDPYWETELTKCGAAVIDLEMKYYGQLAVAYSLRRLISNKEYNVVHSHLGPAEIYSRLALFGRKGPLFIVSRHNHYTLNRNFLESLIGRWVARGVDGAIFISESVLQRYSHDYFSGVDSEVVHYGICSQEFDSVNTSDQISRLRADWGVGKDEVCIGTVARLVPEKSLHHLLEAVSKCNQMEKRIRLIVVGDGPLREELSDFANRLSPGLSAVWTGFREDIPICIGAFDIFALSSKTEGFGLVLLEAMASSKPIVASRVASIPEIVSNGETGILFDFGNLESFTSALDTLISSEAKRIGYGKRGRLEAEKRFDLFDNCRKISLFYERLYSSRLS